jgi:hypothetical protein
VERHTEQMEERPATTPPGLWGDAPCPWRAARGPVAHTRAVLDGGATSPAAARRVVAGAVAGLDREVREDLLLLASELVTNAVIHSGAGDRPRDVVVDVHVSRRWVTVTVTDHGPGFDPGRLTGPRPGVPGAHGLQMVAALSDMRGIDGRDPFRIWFGRLL